MTGYISSDNDLRTEFMRSKNNNILYLYIDMIMIGHSELRHLLVLVQKDRWMQ